MKQVDETRIGPLLASVCRAHAIRVDQAMECTGLYRGQAILLMVLSENDGQTHSELAEKLAISPAAVTKVIKRLEAMQYLQRQSDPADDRVSRVFLREEGRAVIQRIREIFQQVDQILVGSISDEEQKSLGKLLMQVYNNLTQPFPS